MADEPRHDEADQLSNACALAGADTSDAVAHCRADTIADTIAHCRADSIADTVAIADASPNTMQRAMRSRSSMRTSGIERFN